MSSRIITNQCQIEKPVIVSNIALDHLSSQRKVICCRTILNGTNTLLLYSFIYAQLDVSLDPTLFTICETGTG